MFTFWKRFMGTDKDSGYKTKKATICSSISCYLFDLHDVHLLFAGIDMN